MHHYQDLTTIFNQCFEKEYNTQLLKGGEEPEYLPANGDRSFHGIYFAYGYFSSALHECAHWMIAGEERRKLVDFGYWYAPDGRTAEEQALFQQVEVRPQALEWIFSTACRYPFCLSFDNLSGEYFDKQTFGDRVHQQVVYYCTNGLPKRAAHFHQALCQFYLVPLILNQSQFRRESLK